MPSHFIQDVTQISTVKTIVPLADYNDTTDHIVPVHCMRTKTFLFKNTGANPVVYSMLGSMDGLEYDITGVTGATLAANTQILITDTSNVVSIKARFKSAGAAVITSKVVVATY